MRISLKLVEFDGSNISDLGFVLNMENGNVQFNTELLFDEGIIVI